jgi:hypothetical protein
MVHAADIIPADNPNIQYFGRWDFTDPLAPTHSWPGVYIYAEFEGTSIGVRLNDNFCYWNVIIDGAAPIVFKGTTDGVASYTLASGLPEGRHTLLFHKRNETTWLKKSFNGLILDDGKSLLTPPEPPARKIEFIGDSFTSAEWDELIGTGGTDDAPWTNVYEGFGPVVGRHYGAQYHLTSISGWGMVVDWQGDYSKNIPAQFDKTHTFINTPVWDFEAWIPNVAVIGLGLNDYSGFGGWNGPITEEHRNLYKTRYHDFIATIRDAYPGVNILAVASNGLAWLVSAITEIVNEEHAAGHGDVFYAEYSYYTGGYAHDHPTVATHQLIAERLIAAMDSLNIWEGREDTVPPVFTKLPASPFTSYNASFQLNVETDTYATVRYSAEDKPYQDMEHEFTTTGKRSHSVTISCESGRHYTLYLRAMDVNGNAMTSSSVISFDVDTTKARLNWTMPGYDDSSWKTGTTPVESGGTVYFRRVVAIDNLADVKSMGFMVKGFDGAAVYVNGRELDRYNLPEDVDIAYGTHALKPEVMSRTFPINSKSGWNLLKNGDNLFAVEIHSASDTTGVSFDSQLFNNKGQYYFKLGSEWKYSDGGFAPQDQIVENTTGVDAAGTADRPKRLELYPNYPNPFNPATTIRFSLPDRMAVKVEVFDIQGRRLASLDQGTKEPGMHQVVWNTEGLPTCIYLYTVRAGAFIENGKCLLLR